MEECFCLANVLSNFQVNLRTMINDNIGPYQYNNILNKLRKFD